MEMCVSITVDEFQKKKAPQERELFYQAPAGIVILGNDILVNNNLCFDDMSLSIPTQHKVMDSPIH